MKKKKGGRAVALKNEINRLLGTDVGLGSEERFEISRIPTGSLTLDRITGGGFALGRHVELFGDENVGKSYIAYRTMALAQSRGKVCALVDPEHSFDPRWYEHLGGRPSELLTFQPDTGDDAIAAMLTLASVAEENEIEVIAIDSIPSLVPREETEVDPRREPRIAGQARMMSRALRRITSANQNVLFIWVNQERTNVGIKFGNPRTTSGGKALRYYATTRIEFRRGGKIADKRRVIRSGKPVDAEIQVGRWIQVRCEKDKSTRPYREGSFIFDVERGRISEESEIIQLGLLDGLIEHKGNLFYYTDLDNYEYKGTFKQFSKLLANNDDLRRELSVVIQDSTGEEQETSG